MDRKTLARLAKKHGTPLVVVDHKVLRQNYKQFRKHLPRVQVYYSVKANSNGAILRLLRELGSGFDVVSGGELFRVLRIGVDPAQIVFAGVGKTEGELAYALDQRVGWINVESAQELDVLERLAATRSPGANFVTSMPELITVPAISWNCRPLLAAAAMPASSSRSFSAQGFSA